LKYAEISPALRAVLDIQYFFIDKLSRVFTILTIDINKYQNQKELTE
jgi:hypothetical protein